MKSMALGLFGAFKLCRVNVECGVSARRQKAVKSVRRLAARSWHRLYWLKYRGIFAFRKHATVTVIASLFFLISISLCFSSGKQNLLETQFHVQESLGDLKSLLLQLGGALIGAAAIAFSLIMFAMQVNVERMPHGLFRMFSTDGRLLAAFTCTFFIATAITCSSLIHDVSWAAITFTCAGWGTALTFLLFLYAYRRALRLINPLQQLALVVQSARREMRMWTKRAQRAAPLLENEKQETDTSPFHTSHDTTRAIYFKLNPSWTTGSLQAVRHAISFARRYAEQGDHEVSGAALSAIVNINCLYVEAKGKTFFTNHLLMDNPFTTDGFINDTLEHLRQNTRVGVTRGDEQQIEQTLQAMAALVQVYLQIDYSTERASKTHALLASGYLSEAVQSIIPHNMPDVLMEGVRLMGQAAQLLLVYKQPDQIAGVAEKIMLVACTGVANEKHRPVTITAVEQLAKLTVNLIQADLHDIGFAAKRLKQNIDMLAKLVMATPDTPLMSVHSMCMESYYSGTSQQTLQSWLTTLVNALLEAPADDRKAQRVIRNFEDWAEELNRTEKELLLEAIKKKSHLTFDIIYWIAHVTKLILALSNASACDDRTKKKLQKHALWLVSVFSWIPDDKETVEYLENFQITDILFGITMDAQQRNMLEFYKTAYKLLFDWGFKAQRHRTGWATLEQSLYGLAVLALMPNAPVSAETLKVQISARLIQAAITDQEERDQTAREMRRQAESFYTLSHSFSAIEHAMSGVDPQQMKRLLKEIANLLSPATGDEPIRSRHF